MKLLKYSLAVVSAILLFGSCAKPDSEFSHKQNEITAIYLTPAFADIAVNVTGKIGEKDPETEIIKILFPIKKSIASSFDLTKVKVRANVPYDVKITPTLTGIKDLSNEFFITVTATETGEKQKYILQAYYSSDL